METETKTLQLKQMPADLLAQLKSRAALAQVSLRQYVINALQRHVEVQQ